MRSVAEVRASASHAIAHGGARLLRSRRLVRAPIWIYQAHLGFIFGSRMLLLEHVGRKTGTRRAVVLEVIDHSTPDRYVIASGFGTRAQWFQNVRAHPQVRVSVSGRTGVPATARELSGAEADAALVRYVARHARAWRTLKPILENTLGSPISESGTELPMIELQLAQRAG